MTKPTIYTVAHPEDLSPPVANQGFCVDVVLASDYAALESRMEVIRELTGVSENLLEEAQKAYQAQAEELSAAGKMIEKLAAENAALKAFGDKLSEMHNALNGEGASPSWIEKTASLIRLLSAGLLSVLKMQTASPSRSPAPSP